MKESEYKIKENIELIKLGKIFSDEEFIFWLKKVYRLLDSDDNYYYNLCLASICHIADSNPMNPMVQAILNDTMIKSRIFLYREMLGKKNKHFLEDNPLNLISEFAKLFYTDEMSGTVLTKPQKEVLALYDKRKRLVLSAPTSFGKTKILEEIILNNNYKCVAIIVPTNALLSENHHRLKSNSLITDRYKIVCSSKIDIKPGFDQNIIFILTPEKLLNLLDENLFVFDFFVFDEFYKISKDFESDENGDCDRRYKIFQYALYTLVQNPDANFYMIGPYINKFSKNFLEKEGADFKEYDIEIVQKQIFSGKENIDNFLKIDLKKEKKKNLCKVLDRLREQKHQSLIYVPKQETAEKIAEFLTAHLEKSSLDLSENNILVNFIKYIKENISSEWSLTNSLANGIAFHHGGVPRYIQAEIVSLFNSGVIHSLVCTTTLAEGVNTTAKNVIVYESKKDRTPLTTFDRKNIEGRSGRFAEHFLGNVFYLDKPQNSEKETSVNFELYDEKSLGQEDLVLMRDKDLSLENLNNKEKILKKLYDKKIPHELIKKNRFINIDKQINLIESLRSEPVLPFEAILNNGDFIRRRDLFEKLIENIYKLPSIGGRGDWKGYTIKQMTWLAFDYIKHPYFKTIMDNIIVASSSKNVNTRIRKSLRILCQHFEFLLPRYAQAFQEIYNFVAKERGERSIELGYIISLLEYGTSDQVAILLRDAGLPLEIVNKVKRMFGNCENMNALMERKRNIRPLLEKVLNVFELKMLDRYL